MTQTILSVAVLTCRFEHLRAGLPAAQPVRDCKTCRWQTEFAPCIAASRHVPFGGFDSHGEVRIARRRLPHWQQPRVSYFVTFRLADSLPQTLLHQWRDERATWLRWHPEPGLEAEQREYEERFSRRIQEWLDAGMGACHLRRSDVRGEVERCLLHFDGMRYDVDSFALMPNHVHKPCTYYDRPSTPLRSLNTTQRNQGVSANRCNNLLGRKGTFWMDESYDHIVRDSKELAAFRDYIVQNPKKAGLKTGRVLAATQKRPRDLSAGVGEAAVSTCRLNTCRQDCLLHTGGGNHL